MSDMESLATTVAALSRWVDTAPCNASRDPEALGWHRVAKVGEEAGEAISAYLGSMGGNPRKGVCNTREDVSEELLDTALAALGAWEHLTGNQGFSLTALKDKAERVAIRAGLLDAG